METHRRASTALALLSAALVAAGCGNDEAGGAKRTKTDDGPVKVRSVTPPDADDDLADDLGDTAELLTTAGCTFGTYDEHEPEHVDDSEELDSEEFPPTSGTHYDDWAPFGLYDEPVADGYAVHNMEHGGVVVWLGTEVDDATGDAIADLLDDEEKWLVAPRRDIEGLFSAAWTKGLSCPPEALEQLGSDEVADALDEWYETVESTGSEAEKDVPAYAGAMREPSPVRDISAESPF